MRSATLGILVRIKMRCRVATFYGTRFAPDIFRTGFGLNIDLNGLCPTKRMSSFDDNLPRTVRIRLDPNSAHAATVGQLKRIVTHNHARSGDLKSDFAAGKWTFCAE